MLIPPLTPITSWEVLHQGVISWSAKKTVKKLSPFWMNARCSNTQPNPKATVVRMYRMMITVMKNALPDFFGEETGGDVKISV